MPKTEAQREQLKFAIAAREALRAKWGLTTKEEVEAALWAACNRIADLEVWMIEARNSADKLIKKDV